MDSVPRLPIPDWMAMRPSGLITNSPSYPMEPAKKPLDDTPTPRTLVPLRFGRAIRSFHLNCSEPRSSASFRNALVEWPRLPSRGGPKGALPSGALILRMSTWSSASLRAALARIGSIIMMPCMPPGALCGASRRGIGQHRHAAPAHRLGLIQERDDDSRSIGVAICIVRAVVRDGEHIQGGDFSVLGKADFHPALKTGRARPMKCSSSRLMRIITGALAFFASSAGMIAKM